jgi:hypothetical protein
MDDVVPPSVSVLTLPVKYVRQHETHMHFLPSGCEIKHTDITLEDAMQLECEVEWWCAKPDFHTWPTPDSALSSTQYSNRNTPTHLLKYQ